MPARMRLAACLGATLLLADRGLGFAGGQPGRPRAPARASRDGGEQDFEMSMLVASNMIGGGILAIPTVTAEPGFGPSSLAMLALWALSVGSGLCLADVSSAAVRDGDDDVSLRALTRGFLGDDGSAVVSAGYVATNVLLLAAYMAQGGAALAGGLAGLGLDGGFEAPRLAFTCAIVAVVAVPSAAFQRKLDSLFILLMAVSFCAYAGAALPATDLGDLFPAGAAAGGLAQAVPVLASALVFQNIVPTIAQRLGGDQARTRAAVVRGSLGPLLLYVLFDACVLGHTPPDAVAQLARDGAHGLIDAAAGLPGAVAGRAATALDVFTLAAISGSFVGALISQKQETADPGSAASGVGAETKALAVCLLPPLIVAVTSRDVFIPALAFSGTYLNPLLFGVLPLALQAQHLRRLANEEAAESADVPGALPLGAAQRMAPVLASKQPRAKAPKRN